MKIAKLILLLVVLFLIQGCESQNNTQLGLPQIDGLKNIEYTIGDDLPNYLDGVNAVDYLGESITNITVDDQEVDYQTEGQYK